MSYMVGIGGQPQENWDEYRTLKEAKAAALELAEIIAEESDLDPDDVSLYCNADGEMGACPDGDDGAYWPRIEAVG